MRTYLKAVIVALTLFVAGVQVSPSAQVSIQRGWNVVSGYMDIVGTSATYKWVVSGTSLLLQSSTGGAFSTVGTFTSGGQLLQPDGTAAAPSIAFADEPGTGIYKADPNEIDITIGGSRRYIFTTTRILNLSDTGTLEFGGGQDVVLARDVAGILRLNNSLRYTGVLFAALGTPTNGTVTYCSDCTPNVAPCTGAGTGAIAKRLNAAWDCR